MKQSPLLHAHREAGAQIAAREGWLVAARYGKGHGSGSSSLVDLSWLTKFDVRGRGQGTPPRDVRLLALGGVHGLLLCEPGTGDAARAWMVSSGMSVTEVTGGWACFLLTGPHGREILAKLTSADLRESGMADGEVRQSSVAHAPGIVERRDVGGSPAFCILTPRDYAESVWESLLHAGDEFHLVPAGVDEVTAR